VGELPRCPDCGRADLKRGKRAEVVRGYWCPDCVRLIEFEEVHDHRLGNPSSFGTLTDIVESQQQPSEQEDDNKGNFKHGR
jgi:hypothetical protein